MFEGLIKFVIGVIVVTATFALIYFAVVHIVARINDSDQAGLEAGRNTLEFILPDILSDPFLAGLEKFVTTPAK